MWAWPNCWEWLCFRTHPGTEEAHGVGADCLPFFLLLYLFSSKSIPCQDALSSPSLSPAPPPGCNFFEGAKSLLAGLRYPGDGLAAQSVAVFQGRGGARSLLFTSVPSSTIVPVVRGILDPLHFTSCPVIQSFTRNCSTSSGKRDGRVADRCRDLFSAGHPAPRTNRGSKGLSA